MSRLHSSARSIAVAVVLLLGVTALGQPPAAPNPPRRVRMFTWNIHPTSTGGVTPLTRMLNVIRYMAIGSVHLACLQEVHKDLTTGAGLAQVAATLAVINNAINPNVQTYQMVFATEYPPQTGQIGSAPTATQERFYAYIFDTRVVSLRAGTSLDFLQQRAYAQGAAQARPPIMGRFTVHHGNNHDTNLTVVNWHNEAGTFAAQHMATLRSQITNVLEPARRQQNNREDWVVAMDANVQDSNPDIRALESNPNYHVINHDNGRTPAEGGIDYIISSSPGVDINNNVVLPGTPFPAPPGQSRFLSSGRHLGLFYDVFIPR